MLLHLDWSTIMSVDIRFPSRIEEINLTLLPSDCVILLREAQSEFDDGLITEKGFRKRLSDLLTKYNYFGMLSFYFINIIFDTRFTLSSVVYLCKTFLHISLAIYDIYYVNKVYTRTTLACFHHFQELQYSRSDNDWFTLLSYARYLLAFWSVIPIVGVAASTRMIRQQHSLYFFFLSPCKPFAHWLSFRACVPPFLVSSPQTRRGAHKGAETESVSAVCSLHTVLGNAAASARELASRRAPRAASRFSSTRIASSSSRPQNECTQQSGRHRMQ